jgi:hypothetical protein
MGGRPGGPAPEESVLLLKNGCRRKRQLDSEVDQMTVLNQTSESMAGFADQEMKQFNRIFIASFVVFLLVASIARLLPRSLRPWSSAQKERRSVVDEAKAAANRFLPFAFMG